MIAALDRVLVCSTLGQVEVVDRLIVNSTHGEHLRVAFDVTFPHIPCDLLSLDALDTAGQPQVRSQRQRPPKPKSRGGLGG